ncbi:MAG: T9SS type A sorting domain-containing protein, partial [Fibrobacter sp.]|nr:T9SS type A sorting domain-containing protein [Fibrobacter sp.]
GRIQWHKDVAQAAKSNGITPILWDMGNENGKYDNMAYIRRQTQYGKVGTVIEVDVINAMREVYGLGKYENKGVTHVEDFTTVSGGSTPDANCKALTLECGFTPEQLCEAGATIYCTTTIASIKTDASLALTRQGNTLYSGKNIRLFDMNGNLVSTANVSGNKAIMQLGNQKKGMYIAKSGNKSIKVFVR